MKHLFIVNPTAGGKDRTPEVRAKVEKAFANRTDEFEIYVTKAPMDAPGKIREEAASGEPLRVYACGGDGTFNECVCGAALLENVAVCPFPTGTGNDFCRMFGEEKDLYRDFGAAYAKSENWQLYLLSSHTEFERTFGKTANKKRKLYNGMIKCDLFMYF